jgi:hypothetical protein
LHKRSFYHLQLQLFLFSLLPLRPDLPGLDVCVDSPFDAVMCNTTTITENQSITLLLSLLLKGKLNEWMKEEKGKTTY